MHKINKRPKFVNDKGRELRVMRPLSFPRQHLPDRIDLRPWMPPVDHQADMETW